MTLLQRLAQRMLGAGARPVPPPAPAPKRQTELLPGLAELSPQIAGLQRQMGELRGLIHQQSDLTSEALRKAGWQSDDDTTQQALLQRVLKSARGSGDVVAGPWTGEVGFELMYWIPFLTWLVEQGLDRRRLVIVSRGGAAPWYAHLASRYADILDFMSPEEFRERTAGPKKQTEAGREFDTSVIDRVRARLSLGDDTTVIHPSLMYRLFSALWRRKAQIDLVESFTSFGPLQPLAPPREGVDGIPADYVAAKFYFSKAFPESSSNRRFVADLLGNLSRRVPVVLLSTMLRLDEHADFRTAAGSGLFVVDAHTDPRTNLEQQTRILCGARGFVGTYGGFSYLPPFYGIRSLSFFSRRFGFEPHHLQLAERVFDRLMPGGFVALDRHAADLIDPAVERWTRAPQGAQAATTLT